MSAIFRAELASLCRLVEAAQRDLTKRQCEASQQERLNARAAVIDALNSATGPLTSTQIADRSGTRPKQVDYILTLLLKNKTVTRRRSATRRADGQGFRNLYKYRVVTK